MPAERVNLRSYLSLIWKQLLRINGVTSDNLKARGIKESLVATLVWFAYTLFIALPDGLSSKISTINLENNASAHSIRVAWGPGDAGSLLDIALTWSKLKQLDPVTQYWVPHLWSPGISVIEVPLIWLEHIGIPIFWTLLILTLALWATIFFIIWRYYSSNTGRVPIILAASSVYWNWDMRYMFHDFIFYTEGIGFGLLILSLMLISRAIIYSRPINNYEVYVGGLLLGGSIWVRHTSDSGLILLLFLSLSLGIFYTLSFKKRFVKKQNTSKKPSKNSRNEKNFNQIVNWWKQESQISKFAVIGCIFTFPWRLISTFVYHGAPLLMSSAAAGLSSSIWAKPGSPTDNFWGSYGMNWACKIDLKTCLAILDPPEDVAGRGSLLILGIKTAITHPFSYLQERIHYLVLNWIPSFHFNISPPNVIAILLLVSPVFMVWIFFKVITLNRFLILLIWMPFLIMNGLQLTMIHYESRYFIPVRLLILGTILNLLFLYRSEKILFATSPSTKKSSKVHIS